jgi:CIC family chloride channel protein
MGAVFSATIRAPITSVLIIVEMTSGYSLILPLMIANMSAYIIARRWRPVPIYEALLAQDGVRLGDRTVLDTLENLRLENVVRRRDETCVCFELATSAAKLLSATGGSLRQVAFPVLDAEEKLAGLIYAEDLAVLRSDPILEPIVNASDLMRPPIRVGSDDDLRTALELLRLEGVHEVPVLDDEGAILGFIDEAAIVAAFLRATGPTVRPSPP